MTSIGFLGIGTMGEGMVRNLVAVGHELVVWNRTRTKLEPLAAELGLRIASDPCEVARSASVVILCVSSDDAVHELMFGDHGLERGLTKGALLIDCGTTGQPLTQALAAACQALEVGFLDAPITGSKLGAAGGRLTFMVGGPTELVERARPLFEAMGRHTVHVGERVGLGQSAKYCLNLAQAVILQGVLESYALGQLLDVPLAKLAEILDHSAGKTGVGGFKTPYLQAADYTPHFRCDLMHKDLHLALAQAQAHGVPLTTATAVCEVYDQAVAEGLGAQDFLVVATLLERAVQARQTRDPDPDPGLG